MNGIVSNLAEQMQGTLMGLPGNDGARMMQGFLTRVSSVLSVIAMCCFAFVRILAVVVLVGVCFDTRVGAETTDVNSKLSSADGSTAFHVQDSGGVLQAQVDSDGNVIFAGTVSIQGGLSSEGSLVVSSGIRVLQGMIEARMSTAAFGGLTTSTRAVLADLVVNSTAYFGGVRSRGDVVAARYCRPGVVVASASFAAGEVTTTNTSATDLNGMTHTYQIDSVPVMIIATFSGIGRRTEGTNDWHSFSFAIRDGSNNTLASQNILREVGHDHSGNAEHESVTITAGLRVTTAGSYSVKASYWGAYGTTACKDRQMTSYVIPTE